MEGRKEGEVRREGWVGDLRKQRGFKRQMKPTGKEEALRLAKLSAGLLTV